MYRFFQWRRIRLVEMVCFLRRDNWWIRVPGLDRARDPRTDRVRRRWHVFCLNRDMYRVASYRSAHRCLALASFGSSSAQVESFVVGSLPCHTKLAALLWADFFVRVGVGRANASRLCTSSFFRVEAEKSRAPGALKLGRPLNKALQRTRLSYGCFPWRSVRAAELGH